MLVDLDGGWAKTAGGRAKFRMEICLLEPGYAHPPVAARINKIHLPYIMGGGFSLIRVILV